MKRFSCFLLALGLAFSLVVPAAPASADYQSQSNFWQWVASNGGIPQKVLGFVTGDAVCPDSEDGKHHASSAVVDTGTGKFVCTCAYCGETYNATYTDISNAYTDVLSYYDISSVDSSGSMIWSPTYDDFVFDDGESSFGIDLNGYVLTVGSYIPDGITLSLSEDKRSVSFSWNIGRVIPSVKKANNPRFTCPVSGDYTVVESCELTLYYDNLNYAHTTSVASSFINGSYSAGDPMRISWVSETTDVYVTSYIGTLTFPVFRIENIVYDDEDVGDAVDLLSPVTRSTLMTGSYSVVGSNNEVFHHEETIFNEDNSTFYNPVTDTSSNITNWTYDYSTRTYSMTDDNGEEKTLTYGDNNIVINDGGNTFNFYYGNVSSQSSGSGVSGEGSGSGESGDSSGFLSQVGSLLGTLVSGLLGGITAFLSAILSGLTNLVEVVGEGFNGILQAVLGWLAELPQLFHGFLDFVSVIFGYMPAQIISMLLFGVAAVLFIGIIKLLR